MTPLSREFPTGCRALLESLWDGGNVSEPALYHSSLAQSDYSVLFTSNAVELARGPEATDFAVPGALYMIRHGLELWLKCILANRDLDRLLKIIMQEDLSFGDLCEHELLLEGRSRRARQANVSALRTALCVMRNVLEDGKRYPDCRRKRIGDRYADRALEYLRANPTTPRSRLGTIYVPVIGGHDVMALWQDAHPYVDDLCRGAVQHARDCGGGPPLEIGRLEELCVFLHHLDPDGDALRYPFSVRGEWHTHRLRLSLERVGDLARQLTESTRCYSGYRSDVYVHTTVEDPTGTLYFGYDH